MPKYEVKVVQQGKPVFFTVVASNEAAAKREAKTRVVGKSSVTSVRKLDEK